MSTAAGRRTASDADDAPPDAPYAAVCGLYAALLLAPAVAGVLVGVIALTGGGTALLFGVVAVCLAVAVAWLVARTPGFATRVGRSVLAWTFVVAAALACGGYVGLSAGGTIPDVFVLVGVLGSAASLFLGGHLAWMSQTRYARAVVADATLEAEWTAGWPDAWRRPLTVVGAGCVLVGGPALVLGLVGDVDWLRAVGFPLTWAGIVGGSMGRERTYRSTSAGLERVGQFRRVLHDWSTVEEVRLTDDALVVDRRGFLRPAYRCARAQIDDSEAVHRTLSRYVDGQA